MIAPASFHRPSKSILHREYSRKLFTITFQFGLTELPDEDRNNAQMQRRELGLSARERHELATDQLASFDLIHVAPYPSFTRFVRPNKRMFAAMEVFGGVLILR